MCLHLRTESGGRAIQVWLRLPSEWWFNLASIPHWPKETRLSFHTKVHPRLPVHPRSHLKPKFTPREPVWLISFPPHPPRWTMVCCPGWLPLHPRTWSSEISERKLHTKFLITTKGANNVITVCQVCAWDSGASECVGCPSAMPPTTWINDYGFHHIRHAEDRRFGSWSWGMSAI